MRNVIFADRSANGSYRADVVSVEGETYTRLRRIYRKDRSDFWTMIGRWEREYEVRPDDVYIARTLHGLYDEHNIDTSTRPKPINKRKPAKKRELRQVSGQGNLASLEQGQTSHVIIKHNLKPASFQWLWAKYVRGFNKAHHSSHALLGKYSHKLSKHNDHLTEQTTLVMDEVSTSNFSVIYVCGIAAQGYRQKKNHDHNLHMVIAPQVGATETFSLDEWKFDVENGTLLTIPTEAELPEQYRNLSSEFVDSSIFRWGVNWFASSSDRLIIPHT